MWSSGMNKWKEIYDMRFKTWLSAVESAEAKMTEPNLLATPLSTYLRESWDTGRGFLSYGCKKSWAFDAVYWRYLDGRFFGSRESGTQKLDLWRTRVHLLSEDERAAMEPFVEKRWLNRKTGGLLTGN